jgi:hypothetical protein
LLPLDNCLYALQPTIPHLTRSSLYRCLQRHEISRLPQVEGEASAKRKFKAYPIGYFHIDLAEVRTAQGKLYLIVAIDRTSKFAFVEMHEKVARRTAGDFLRRLIAAVPYKVHTVLTDDGTHFITPGNTSSEAPGIKAALDAGEPVWAFIQDCPKHFHRLALLANKDRMRSMMHEPLLPKGFVHLPGAARGAFGPLNGHRRLCGVGDVRDPCHHPVQGSAVRLRCAARPVRARRR